ncbi:MAG: ATP-binding cassette domain-containing protein, partial [Muribaculaceae bacterium]|nr:ATP-binding cassette domain-containing protein [Muribaculaceae bacterium]
MVSLNSLGLEFSARPLFKDVSFVINKTDKMALVGKNGAGKSTMMKIIAGLQEPSSGSVSMPSDIVIGYLPQEMKVADDTTLINETRKVFSASLQRKAELQEVSDMLETRTDYE